MNDNRLSLLRHHFGDGHITRRQLVRRAGALGISLPVVSALLAACGGSSNAPSSTSAATSATGGGATATKTPVTTINQNATPSGSPAAAATSAPLGKAGGSVTFVRGADSDNLDPVTNDGNINIWVFMSIYDQLIKVANNGLDLAPSLAEKWDTSADGTTFTFHIRQGVKFSDGTPMTVDDIKYSLNRAKTQKGDGDWTFTLAQVKDIASPDANTIVITLNEPWAPFLADISMFNSSVISQAFAQKIGEDKLNEQCMGTGPFALKAWNKAQNIILVKNPNYWQQGLPLVDQITLNVVPDSNSRILQVKGGQVDGDIGQNDVPLSSVADLKAQSDLQVINFVSTYVNFVDINCRNAPLSDVKVRQALNYATDKESLIKTILYGQADVSNSFMPNGALYWNKDQTGYPYDINKAKDLVSQSSSPNGVNISMDIGSGNQLSQQIATALKSMWQPAGINLDIQQYEQAVATDRYRTNKFELRLTGWTNDIIDPDELVSYAITPETNQNYHTGWVNQQAIDLAHQGEAELDPEKRRQIYYQIQKIHMDDAPFVYLYVLPYIDVLNKKVQGFFHHPMGQYDFTRMSVQS
ncbi:MAG TPA: ABC transporter substrate-binding protein [Thermomicrobiaceae bacterium]|nr:ABC transporter substrate-binding protein [Thermomicrobiaceae bacterium]